MFHWIIWGYRVACLAAHRLCYGILLAAALASLPAQAQNRLYQAEAFQSWGAWSQLNDDGFPYLIFYSGSADLDAQTAIDVTTAQVYHVWAKCKDYPAYLPGTRRYRIIVDTAQLGEVGNHNHDGWYWQKSGTVTLSAGRHVVALHNTSSGFGRCDAVVFLTSSVDPNTLSASTLNSYAATPPTVPITLPSIYTRSIAMPTPGTALATLDNGQVKITFHNYTDGGQTYIWRRTAVKLSGAWVDVTSAPTSETLLLLDQNSTSVFYRKTPAWTTPQGLTSIVTSSGTIQMRNDPGDPYQPGRALPIAGTSVQQINASTVDVNYTTSQATSVVGRWTLAGGEWNAKFSLTLTPRRTAYYSVGFLGFRNQKLADVDYLEVPPLYQFQRLPTRAELVSQEIMPNPLALMQIKKIDGSNLTTVSLGVVAEPTRLDLRWADANKARYGFSIRDPRGLVQPAVFSPFFGEDNSLWTAGTPQTIEFRVLSMPGDWKASLQYAMTNIFKVTDYRKPTEASLSDAATNIFELINNTNACGWSDELKGFWDIEGTARSKQAAPLVVLSAAMLQQDDAVFAQRALPTLAFTMARPNAWIDRPSTSTLSSQLVQVPTPYYATSHWLGAERLLGGLNPWLDEFALPNGNVTNGGMSSELGWSEKLALYLDRPTTTLLATLRTEANTYLANKVNGRQETPVSFTAFYNVSFYPYWWDMQDLANATGDSRYLSAAEVGANNTLAGLWSYPTVSTTATMTIHANNQVAWPGIIWSKDTEKYRLGFDPITKALDPPGTVVEKTIDQWKVSRVGYALEQPSTYWLDPIYQNIQLACWAPILLRLSKATGNALYETYARNAVIGRFANYPGYYIDDFSDIQQKANYPYVGPDITSIYYHHIPPHLGMTLDYLFTEAEARSGGKIAFPWVKQKNYVWFTHHVYGTQAGKLYGESGAVPWMRKNLVQLNSINVDALTARSAGRFFLVLMNQLNTTQTVSVNFSTTTGMGLKLTDPYRQYTGTSDTPVTLSGQGTGAWSVSVPPRGLRALSIPATRRTVLPELPPLQAGHWIQNAPDTWGKLHTFRVRSPLGSDGLVSVVTGGPSEGATVTYSVAGGPTPTVDNHYPYETTIYPWAYDQPMSLTAQFNWPQYGGTKALSLQLPAITMTSAKATAANTIELTFSSAVSTTSGATVARYTLSPAITISSAVVSPDQLKVTLTLATNLATANDYQLTVKNLLDANMVELAWQQAPVDLGTWAWSYHRKLKLDCSLLTSTLEPFPLLVRILPAQFTMANFRADGSDLRFTDSSGNDLPHEIERWNATDGGVVWVRAPQLLAGSTTGWVGMHFGLPRAWKQPATLGSVWKGLNFSGIWHMGATTDASPNQLYTVTGGAPTAATGVIGQGYSFDGNDELNADDDDALDLGTSSFMLSAWIKKNSLSTMMVASKDFGYVANKWEWGWGTSQIGFRTNDRYYYTASGSLTAGTWYHVAFVRNGNTGYSYVNGALSGGPHDMTGLPALDSNVKLLIGRREYNGPGYYFNGMLDELRVERTWHSSAYIKACYLNQRSGSTFITFETWDGKGLDHAKDGKNAARNWTQYSQE